MHVAREAGGALCAGRSALQKGGGGGPTSVNQLQARASRSSTLHPPPLLRSPLSQERHYKQTRHQITHAGCGKRHSAAPADRDAVPECTVRRAATTGGVPAKFSLQPTIPYAPIPCFHINPTVSETAELPVQFANRLPIDCLWHMALTGHTVQNTCITSRLVLTHAQHSTANWASVLQAGPRFG